MANYPDKPTVSYPTQPTDWRNFSPNYAAALRADPVYNSVIDRFVNTDIMPYFNPAVKVAEGNPNNFGILSQEVRSPEHANALLNDSIRNNVYRWLQAGKPGKFVDFFRDRYAPIGATNDKKNKNINWAPNVRKNLKKQLGPEMYDIYKQMNLVNIPWEGNQYA